jgi:glycosyltransferase involved in cell wall biosynthesis
VGVRTKRVILAQFNAADGYPPVLNQAGILAERAEVTLLDTGSENARMIEIPGVNRLRVYWERGTKLEKFSRLKARFEFARRLSTLAKQRPDAIIAFEPDAIALMIFNDIPKNCLRIGHLHEHPSPGVYTATLDRLAQHYMRRHANELGLLVVADENRARVLHERWQLKERPLVVRNCPRHLDNVPGSRLLSWLKKRGVKPGGIVYYQGSIGANQGIDQVVAGMPSWPDNSILVLVGHIGAEFKSRVECIAAEGRVLDRVCFLGPVPYDQVFSYASGADVALSLLNPASEQLRFAAGASNKRFEYAALGIPQITTVAPGIEETFVSTGAALAVPWGDNAALARAISHLLENPALRQSMGEKARALHLLQYNYEREFEPVMERIMDANQQRPS